ncbi:MAG: hypothetical protein RL005_512 [Planctomycetota bacterium]
MRPPQGTLSLADSLRALVRRGDVHLPAVPGITFRLQEVLRDERGADAHQVAEVVASEPAIATSMLRLANSVAFGGLRPVLELHEAVARVGLRQIESLATTIATRGAFRSSDPARSARLEQLWAMAVTAAVTSREVPYGEVDPEVAYLSGLLHDIGQPLVLKLLDTCESRLVDPIAPAAVEGLLDELHVELGHRLLMNWRIPEPVCQVTQRHHGTVVPEDVLLVRVQAADVIAHHLALPATARPGLGALVAEPAIARLGLDDERLAERLGAIEERVAILRLFL